MSRQSQIKYICEIISAAMVMMTQSVIAADDAENTTAILPSIEVEGVQDDLSSEQTGEYKIEKSRTATRLDLDLKDTPQSMTVITRQQMNDFGLDTLNDALNFTPSVNVEQTETDRTYYTSRGFAITNFQVDSLAIPTSFDYPIVFGDVDTVIYDRLEVLRGANGLLTGTGNPAATINYIRKRPTDEFQASVKGTVGSWDKYRAEADVSGSLNQAGTIRGRFVTAYEDKNSYIDRYSKQRQVAYGVIDFQLSDSTILTAGHTYQRDEPNANLWGALPLTYSDGSQVAYDTSANSAPSWAYWNNQTNDSFVELKSNFDNGWQTTAQVTRVTTDSHSQLFYVYGSPAVSDGSGLGYVTGKYNIDSTNYVADAYASGPFEFAGREHELVVGAQWAQTDKDHNGVDGPDDAITLDEVLSGSTGLPVFGPNVDQGDIDANQRSVYTAAKLNFTEAFNLIVGTRYIDYDIENTSYGTDDQGEAKEWIPYIGGVYSVTDRLNAYASYTSIFQPQSKIDVNNRLLDPAEGNTYEVGLKMDFNDARALGTLSLFKTEQDNLAELAGYNSNGQAYYSTQDVESHGVEVDFTGEVIDGLNVISGYTYVSVDDVNGDRTRLYIPRQTIKLAGTYQLPSAPKWKVGANVKWQSEIEDTSVDLEQGAYSVWGAMASYDVTPKLTTTLNLYNIFDEKYYTSFYDASGQTYYAAPRSAVISMNYDF